MYRMRHPPGRRRAVRHGTPDDGTARRHGMGRDDGCGVTMKFELEAQPVALRAGGQRCAEGHEKCHPCVRLRGAAAWECQWEVPRWAESCFPCAIVVS